MDFQLSKNSSFLTYIYINVGIYIHKSFSATLDKDLRKNIQERKRRDGEIGEHELNDMGTLNMKYKK